MYITCLIRHVSGDNFLSEFYSDVSSIIVYEKVGNMITKATMSVQHVEAFQNFGSYY